MEGKEKIDIENFEKFNWHEMNATEVIQLLSNEKGLADEEVKQRIARYGKNELPEVAKKSEWIRFLLQFNNVLIYVLIVASSITAWLGDWLDTGVIWAVIIINALIGYIQEGKAERALESLKKMLSLSAVVIRNGEKLEVPALELVPGDLVLLKAGDKVPADMRLLESKTLKAQEAVLTGESLPIEKEVNPLPEGTVLADRKNMLYSGTVITFGTGKALVIATGSATEIGKISGMMTDVARIETPLIQKMNAFGKTLSIVILLFSALFFIYGYFIHQYHVEELFPAVIGLAVAAIPEGLPALMTITLALGVQNMARRNAIIRHLPSVETLGSVSVICSDKTGTLTKNEMTVKSIVTKENHYSVSGAGYDPKGSICLGEETINDFTRHHALLEALKTGAWCNDAKVVKNENDRWELLGDPTEGALITLSLKAEKPLGNHHRLDSIPFDSEHKYMATLVENEDGEKLIYVKGAPEKLLSLCALEYSGQDQSIESTWWEKEIESLAGLGQRVIALAFKTVDKNKNSIDKNDLQEGLQFIGICGMIDPPSPEVLKAVQSCQNAGIVVKMITGDHAVTAKAVGSKLNITNENGAITGIELDELEESQWVEVAEKYNVFARTTPAHKLKLVEALQQNNHITAMTGDGVNDAPSLKRANVGIAMGIKGTEVTKDAAEMVLTDDNFTSISAAVRQGRTTFDNIKKAIMFILPTNGAEALVIIFALMTGTSLPITPAQILWINMVTAVTLGLALAFEPPEPKVMSRPPRQADAPFLDSYLLFRILFVSILLGGLTLILYRHLREAGVEINYARTVAVNMLVVGEAYYLVNCRFLRVSVFNKSFFSNIHVLYSIITLIFLQLILIYTPFMQRLFDTTPIEGTHWFYIVIGGLIMFLIIELEKLLYQKFFNRS
jgi:P-type Ca2+ transporter type 2C